MGALTLAIIVTNGLAPYGISVAGLNLNVDRALMLFLMYVFAIEVLATGFFDKRATLIALTFLFSILGSLFAYSIDYDMVMAYLPNMVHCYVLFFFVFVYCRFGPSVDRYQPD